MQKSNRTKKLLTTTIILASIAALLILLAPTMLEQNGGIFGVNIQFAIGCTFAVVATIFSILTFVSFVRSKSVSSGLFVTVSTLTLVFALISTALSNFLPVSANTRSLAVVTNSTVLVLSQIGLFTLWFILLIVSIHAHVKPIKRIEKALTDIVDKNPIEKLKIGNSKQYKQIEHKLAMINHKLNKPKKPRVKKAKIEIANVLPEIPTNLSNSQTKEIAS